MSRYFAFLHPPEVGPSWGVTFPDLPGCTSAGDSFEDAADQAREALSGHLAALRADGGPVPPARTFVDLIRDPEVVAELAGCHLHYVVPRRLTSE